MTGSDDEFEEFLKRRKPKFLPPDDLFEPPAELDRVVLRQAREAIQTERPVRIFRGPRWAAPVALAATLVLTFTVMFHATMPPTHAPVPEVTVQNVAERVEIPDAVAPMAAAKSAPIDKRAREEADASGTVMVDLANPMIAKRESAAGAAPSSNAPELTSTPAPPAAPMVAPRPSESVATDASGVVVTAPAAKSEVPAWRRDPNTWLAEIERLRKAGDTEHADAELAEYNRQRRAYAVGPDR